MFLNESGKTAFVKKHAKEGDLIIDFDLLMSAISLQDPHAHFKGRKDLVRYALATRGALICEMVLDPTRPRTWFIMTSAVEKDREQFQAMFDAEVIVIATPKHICLDRLRTDPMRSHQVDESREVIGDWWHEFSPRAGKETIYDWEG